MAPILLRGDCVNQDTLKGNGIISQTEFVQMSKAIPVFLPLRYSDGRASSSFSASSSSLVSLIRSRNSFVDDPVTPNFSDMS